MIGYQPIASPSFRRSDPPNSTPVFGSIESDVGRYLVQPLTTVLLENIQVLAVDQTASTEQNEPVIVRAVTLEVDPEQAEIVVRARTEGEIQLTLTALGGATQLMEGGKARALVSMSRRRPKVAAQCSALTSAKESSILEGRSFSFIDIGCNPDPAACNATSAGTANSGVPMKIMRTVGALPDFPFGPSLSKPCFFI